MSYNVWSGPSSYGNVFISTGGSGSGYTYPSTNTNWTIATNTTANPMVVNQGGRIDLKGSDADLVINGESLSETLKSIKEALRIPGRIQQDAKLERDFEELTQIRKQYEQKVREYKEKQQVWDTLKNQDL